MILIDNLNLSHLMMIIYLLIIAGTDLRYQSAMFGRYALLWNSSTACRVAHTLIHLSIASSTFLSMVISIDRFFCCSSSRSTSSSSSCSTLTVSCCIIIVIIVWLISIALSIIPVIIQILNPGIDQTNFQSSLCIATSYKYPILKTWLTAFILVTFITLGLACITYILMLIMLAKNKVTPVTPLMVENYSISIQSMILFITSLSSMLPYYIFYFKDHLNVLKIDIHSLEVIAIYSLPLSSATYPIIYTLTNILYSKKSKITQRVSVQPVH